MAQKFNIHATGIRIRGVGVLVRGPSGAGKSLLALEMLLDAEREGKEAVLVADDRLDVIVVSGGVEMAVPPEIAGKIELRGRGIVLRPYIERSRVDLVVDLVPDLERMPAREGFKTLLGGVEVACCPVPVRGVVDPSHQRLLVYQALAELD